MVSAQCALKLFIRLPNKTKVKLLPRRLLLLLLQQLLLLLLLRVCCKRDPYAPQACTETEELASSAEDLPSIAGRAATRGSLVKCASRKESDIGAGPR